MIHLCWSFRLSALHGERGLPDDLLTIMSNGLASLLCQPIQDAILR